MFNNFIFFQNNLGQKKNGFNNTIEKFDDYLKNKNKKNIQITNDLFINLNNLYNEICKNKEKKIIIGGDHSMAISTVADSLNKYDNLKVIWFDAHPDINNYENSISKNYHGMPLSFLTNDDFDSRLKFINKYLSYDNLLYIGIRDIDDYEMKIINNNNIKFITSEFINNNSEQSLKIIKNFINNDYIHISFDVDCLDPKFIKSTGTMVNNGLELEKTKYIIDNLINEKIVNLDITELNLSLGSEEEKKESFDNVTYLFKNYI